MKPRIYLILLALMLAFPLHAQSGLHIATLFNGQYRDSKDATEVLMKGRKLTAYKLTLFRSLTLNTKTANVSQIEKLVRADAASAVDKEASLRGGHLYYGFYQLKPVGKTRRYLFYRNNSLKPGGNHTATLTIIYMEGTATIDELKKTFAK